MMFSMRVEYGLRAVLWLARHWGTKPVSLTTIADEERISKGYLEKLVVKLTKAKILLSTKGVNGGYVLARKPSDITIQEVVAVLNEKNGKPYQCPAVTPGVECSHEPTCSTKHVWKQIADTLESSMQKTTLADIIWK